MFEELLYAVFGHRQSPPVQTNEQLAYRQYEAMYGTRPGHVTYIAERPLGAIVWSVSWPKHKPRKALRRLASHGRA